MRLPQDRILHIDTELKNGKVNVVAEWQGELVRCKDCRWYDPPHIVTDDGFRVNVSGIFPTETELRATFTDATYVGGRCDCPRFKVYCTAHNREDPEDCEDIVVFRRPDEYCSMGEREEADS